MPWQQMVADVGLEYEIRRNEIIPAYREVVVTVPRQNGKTTLVLSMECQRALGWPTPQRVAYTAQTGWDARRKLIDDQAPILMSSQLAPTVHQVMRGAGNESVIFHNGSRIDVLASTETAGHGKTLDFVVMDEVFADTDTRREAALVPTQATRRSAQIMVISTAGTDASLFLRGKVDAGRHAVTTGATDGIAYFEWSAPDDADPYDEATWLGCMPALGRTIDLAVVRHAAASMTEGEFRRAFLNQWTASDERVIPKAAWEAVQSEQAAPSGPLVFAIDVSADRAESSVAVAGGGVVGLAEHRPGTSWVVEWVKANAKSATVVVQQSGPAGALVPDLERTGATVVAFTAADMAKACGAFYDDVADRKVTVRRHWKLDKAAAGATKRQNGDAWTWDRRDATVDVSPLVAVTAAHWRSSRIKPVEPWIVRR